jgi:hypothetical protein
MAEGQICEVKTPLNSGLCKEAVTGVQKTRRF